MKTVKSTFIGILIIAFIFFVFSVLERSGKGVDQTYLLAKGFEGCVVIYYNIENAPPLEITDNEIVYRVPEDGIIHTSSPYHFGWVNEEHSGGHKVKAFYVDKDGQKLEELPQEKIRFAATGSMQEDRKPEQHYFYQIFGSEETEQRGCEKVHSAS